MKGPRKPKKETSDPSSWGPNKMLDTLQQLLIARPKGWFNQCVFLNDQLVAYLRGNGNDPRWEEYPIARDWFTQNNLQLEKRDEVAA